MSILWRSALGFANQHLVGAEAALISVGPMCSDPLPSGVKGWMRPTARSLLLPPELYSSTSPVLRRKLLTVGQGCTSWGLVLKCPVATYPWVQVDSVSDGTAGFGIGESSCPTQNCRVDVPTLMSTF
jgi:hypothetical protein